MKRHLFLLLIPVLIFFSCEKEEEVKPATKEKIQGYWTLPNYRDTFYDESGKLVYEHVEELNGEFTFYGDSLMYFFRYDLPEEKEHYLKTYSIYKKDGKDYLRIGNETAGYSDSEIRFISANQIALVEERVHINGIQEVRYPDGTSWKEAHRRETIRLFFKK